jgi:hypothetical protein
VIGIDVSPRLVELARVRDVQKHITCAAHEALDELSTLPAEKEADQGRTHSLKA